MTFADGLIVSQFALRRGGRFHRKLALSRSSIQFDKPNITKMESNFVHFAVETTSMISASIQLGITSKAIFGDSNSKLTVLSK